MANYPESFANFPRYEARYIRSGHPFPVSNVTLCGLLNNDLFVRPPASPPDDRVSMNCLTKNGPIVVTRELPGKYVHPERLRGNWAGFRGGGITGHAKTVSATDFGEITASEPCTTTWLPTPEGTFGRDYRPRLQDTWGRVRAAPLFRLAWREPEFLHRGTSVAAREMPTRRPEGGLRGGGVYLDQQFT